MVIMLGGGFDAVDAFAEFGHVQIHGEDALFAPHAFHHYGNHGFFGFTHIRAFGKQE